MPLRFRFLLLLLIACGALLTAAQAAGDRVLRVAVLENSPPMAFKDANGALTGFSVEVMRALCVEMRTTCNFQVTTLNQVIDQVASGEIDVAAVSLLDTPERRARVVFAKPYFRSVTLWFAKPGVRPGQAGIRVAVVRGSAQERYARANGWDIVGVRTNGELGEPLLAGVAQAAIVPMSSGYNQMKRVELQQLDLVFTVLTDPALTGEAAFGISPHRAELKELIDAAIDRIKGNGIYDRINSKFLPFRVN